MTVKFRKTAGLFLKGKCVSGNFIKETASSKNLLEKWQFFDSKLKKIVGKKAREKAEGSWWILYLLLFFFQIASNSIYKKIDILGKTDFSS